MNQTRQDLIIKINNLKQDDLLVLTEEEVKYCIERWIKGNYNNITCHIAECSANVDSC